MELAVRRGRAIRRNPTSAMSNRGRRQWRCKGARGTRHGDITPRHAHARRVPRARVAHRVVQHAAGHGRPSADAVLGEQRLELPVLFDQPGLVLRHIAEDFFQAEHLVLERLDVELLALAVGPLGLPVEFLAPCQGGLAVWLGAAALLRLAICVQSQFSHGRFEAQS